MPETKESFTQIILGQPADVRRLKKIVLLPTSNRIEVTYEYGFGDPFVACEPPQEETFVYNLDDLSTGDQSTVNSAVSTLHTKATTDHAPRIT